MNAMPKAPSASTVASAPDAPAAATMTLLLNGQPQQCEANMTLEALLAQQALAATSVATAVNAVFVPRSARQTHVLHEGDSVTLFRPISGG